MDFAAAARKTQRPTIEHLQPRSLGGGDGLDNLALCHPGCNRQLADRPRAEKERLRARRLKRIASRTAPAPMRAPVIQPPRPLAARPRPPAAPGWRRIALIAMGAALFLAGLCAGMLIA